MNIILVGFMGTGKTVTARRLAKRLGWKFVDIDRAIEEAAGMPVPKIFTERGEPVFRRLERRCVHRIVKGSHQVIATGGGAFVDEQVRARLRVSGPVICLTSRPQVILDRVKSRVEGRPLLQGHANPLARIKSLLRSRASAYAKADLTLDTSDETADQTAERIWKILSPSLCKSWQFLLDNAKDLCGQYGGKYVVVVNNKIIASGATQLEAYQKAGLSQKAPAASAAQSEAGIYYIPLPSESMTAL